MLCIGFRWSTSVCRHCRYKVKDGYAEFVINHCSEYFLTGAVVNDAVNNPKSLNYVIVGLAGLVIALVGYTLFKRR